MSKKTLIIGDSHTHAFKRFLKLNSDETSFEALTFAKIKNEVLVGDELLEDIKKRLESQQDDYNAIVSFTGGNQHNSVSLIQHKETFSLANKCADAYVGDGLGKLPREALKYIFDKGLRAGDFKKLKSIQESTILPIFHVAATPPKKSTEHILNRPESDFVRKNIVDLGVTDAYLRLEVYKVQMEVTKDLCSELGITFIDLPDKVTDEDGFLAEQYYADDATHANIDFAEVIISILKNQVA